MVPIPTTQHDDLEERVSRILDLLWDFARVACRKIESFDPDVILVLYHSGQAVLRATQAAWHVRCALPFPPVVRVNLGREKIKPYDKLREELGQDPLIGFLDTYEMSAHFLAWIAGNTVWQTELGELTRSVCESDAVPSRVLVFDDFYHEGGTSLLALGLLQATYPHAEAELLAGALDDWKTAPAHHWLKMHYPEACARMEADKAEVQRQWQAWVMDSRATQSWEQDCEPAAFLFQHAFTDLKRIVPGTEDIEPGSLLWRSLTSENEALRRLTAYLPVEIWLSLPEIIYTQIECHVRKQALDPIAWDARLKHMRDTMSDSLRPDLLALREAWLHGRLTRRDVMRAAGFTPYQATRFLKRWTEQKFLVRRRRGGGTFYELRHYGILAYGSLLADPGEEIAAATVKRVPVTTPFAVEYARSSRGRAGAPTLVPIANGVGAPVEAQVLVIRPDMDPCCLQNMLYRWEINCVGQLDMIYDDEERRAKADAVVIEAVEDLAGVRKVFYTSLTANIPDVLRADLVPATKADVLARLAIESVTAETYPAGRDGIRYLADATMHGISTPLTELYCAAILRLAEEAPDLETARERIARDRGYMPFCHEAQGGVDGVII